MNIEVSNTKCDIFNELESVNYGYIITCHNLLRCIYPLIKYINNKKCCNIEFKLTIYETFMFKIEDCKNGIIFKCYNHVGIDTYRQMLKKFVNYCENDQRSNSIFNSDISIYCLGLAYVKENYLTYIDKDKFSNDFYKILKSNNLNIEYIKHFDLEKDKNNEIMLIEYEKRKKKIYMKINLTLLPHSRQSNEKNLSTTFSFNVNTNKTDIKTNFNNSNIDIKNKTNENFINNKVNFFIYFENDVQDNNFILNSNIESQKVLIKFNSKFFITNLNEFYLIYEQSDGKKISKKQIIKIESIQNCCEKYEIFKLTICVGKPLNITQYNFKNNKKLKHINFNHHKLNKNQNKISCRKSLDLNVSDVEMYNFNELKKYKTLNERCKSFNNHKQISSNYLESKNTCVFLNKNFGFKEIKTNQVFYGNDIFFIFLGMFTLIAFFSGIFVSKYLILKMNTNLLMQEFILTEIFKNKLDIFLGVSTIDNLYTNIDNSICFNIEWKIGLSLISLSITEEEFNIDKTKVKLKEELMDTSNWSLLNNHFFCKKLDLINVNNKIPVIIQDNLQQAYKTKIIPYVITWDGVVTKYHKKYLLQLQISPNIEAYIQSRRHYMLAIENLTNLAQKRCNFIKIDPRNSNNFIQLADCRIVNNKEELQFLQQVCTLLNIDKKIKAFIHFRIIKKTLESILIEYKRVLNEDRS
ncbi:hypothetical protein NAPIS_ORF01225 [Vairimorpha apis BRL 01]|uniref:Uncharacterized protein n=1 Tax=Vairimorpha apis BRL 01 TaxID=1037528 RepID=T0L9R1_9MICR|nr:hypothetical protein NAPIS_ORF01225 [Vairimorpha apis BRL 01]